LESWKVGSVKTTLDLPSDLIREMKLRAAHEGRKLRDVATEIFRRGLAQPSPQGETVRKRVKLPLIECGNPVTPASELTTDQLAEVLLKQEVEWSHEAAGR
jgi:plasmid stability protein